MSDSTNIFKKFLFEADDDVPPDVAAAEDSAPPDLPDGAPTDDGPPELPDDSGGADDSPPDMGGDDFGGDEDEFGGDDGGGGDEEGQQDQNLGLDEKISAIMNMNLYQRYLTLLNTIGGQLTTIKNNSDILYTLSSDSLDIVDNLKKLDENIRLYLRNSFMHENYSKNLLFFNKCLNLLKLLNDQFDGTVRRGIRALQ